jgi:hypothetical protein
MTSSVELFKNYSDRAKIFIETGTFSGGGIQCALDSGFEKVYSCDINGEYVENARTRYANKNVVVEHLESQLFLPKVMSELNERAVIFLDAHSMPYDMYDGHRGFGEDTVREGLGPCPLINELEIIKTHSIKNHIILIDDFQCFDTWMFEGLQFDDVNDFVLTINSKYKVKFFHNVLCYKTND